MTKKKKKISSKKAPKKVEKKLNLPKIVPAKAQEKALKQKFTTGYYHCLDNNWTSGKITDCCAKCKKDARNLTIQRESEIEKLGKAYRQMGDSLVSLLRPIKPIKH